ncbi:MAG TPA: hypothetical protein PLZ46_07425 [Bacteroidales bacterium]|nr:hypothetical protein [Bacteroidales bacterium]
MKIKRYLFLTFTATLLLSGCKPEFNQNADYKDITISYGILNPKDTVHYIKVYKAFLTDGNAIVAARNLDNISYYDSIEVFVEEYENERLTRSIPFYMTTAVPKDSGIFAYDPQVIYYSTATLNEKNVYKLKIFNKMSGKEITATTPLVGKFSISQPFSDIASFLTSSTATLKFGKAPNAVAYDVYLKFYYIELDKFTGDTIDNNGEIVWRVTRIRSEQPTIEVSLVLKQLYQIIANRLRYDENIVRHTKGADCITLEVWGAEKNYMIYLDVNEPSSSLVQDRVFYTNMVSEDKSAYGIFSSRNMAKRTYKLINSPNNAALDSLRFGSITGHLGFQ